METSKDNFEDGYTFIELLIVISIISIMLTTLLLANNFIARSLRRHREVSLIQQDLRVSMDNIVESLRGSLYIIALGQDSLEKVNEGEVYTSITYLDGEGRRREVYYKDDIGLASNSDSNIISNRVRETEFALNKGSLISIRLKGGEGEEEFELRSGVRIVKD